jgi:hypothetical protein
LKEINSCVNQGGMHNQFVEFKMNLFICSNLFVMGKLIMFLVSHEVVITIIKMFKDLISWPSGNEMQQVMVGIGVVYLPYKVPSMGHTSIKLNIQGPFLKIMSGCNIIVQAIISCNKMFTNLFVGLHGNVNDFKVLRRSTLRKHAQYHGLFEHIKILCDFPWGQRISFDLMDYDTI